ncbi:MAG: hypothetical protein HY541_00145 [Deltaproteobacteria bacterium]|nr:hypothetical protein [Deltaproteobacteria bacterium]
MRLKFPFIFGLLFFTFHGLKPCLAQPPTVSLKIADSFVAQTCAIPVWSNLTVVWKGVKDSRAVATVGKQEKKGEIITEVMADPAVETAFDNALKKLLPACGMKLTEKKDENLPTLSVAVEEFFAGEEKKFLTGKAEAQSRLLITAERSGQTTLTTEIGFQIESKKVRRKNIKQLEATLNELFADTLKQVITSPYLRDLK